MKTIKCDNENIKQIIEEQIELLGNEADLNHLDVSGVTNMERMFGKSEFDGNIGSWDVSGVKNMRYMFIGSKFNGDISGWDVSEVTDMGFIFHRSVFSGDISKWDVSEVTDMGFMFCESKFNGDISKWDVSNVTNMYSMFQSSKFNGDISGWDVSSVSVMRSMFVRSGFNGDISKWDVSGVRFYGDMESMFVDCPIQEENKSKSKIIKCDNENIKQIIEEQIELLGNEADLNHLDVSGVTNMKAMFLESEFNGDISGWDVSNVTDMNWMFEGSKFDSDISGWNAKNVVDISSMFNDCPITDKNKPMKIQKMETAIEAEKNAGRRLFDKEFNDYGILDKIRKQYSAEEMESFEAEYRDFLEWSRTYNHGYEGNGCVFEFMKKKSFNPILFIISDIFENENLEYDGWSAYGTPWKSMPYYLAEVMVKTAINKNRIEEGELLSVGWAELPDAFTGIENDEEAESFADFIIDNYTNIYSRENSGNDKGCYGGEKELMWLINNFDFEKSFDRAIYEHIDEINLMYKSSL